EADVCGCPTVRVSHIPEQSAEGRRLLTGLLRLLFALSQPLCSGLDFCWEGLNRTIALLLRTAGILDRKAPCQAERSWRQVLADLAPGCRQGRCGLRGLGSLARWGRARPWPRRWIAAGWDGRPFGSRRTLVCRDAGNRCWNSRRRESSR